MEVFYDTINAHYCLNLCGMRKHKVDLGTDALGNLTRIENEIAKPYLKHFLAEKQPFSALSATKTTLSDTLVSIVSAYSNWHCGLLCGQ